MHELGIMTSVLDAVQEAAADSGATRILKVDLKVGEMTEAIVDALEFAFGTLKELPEYNLCATADLNITMVAPKSRCLECGTEFQHDRFHMLCPQCGSFATRLLEGREMEITSIEVDLPDDEEAGVGDAGEKEACGACAPEGPAAAAPEAPAGTEVPAADVAPAGPEAPADAAEACVAEL